MFMCTQILEQFEDSQLAYTMILANRMNHPAADMYVMKFSSKAAVQAFLTRISNQHQLYVLTKKGKGADKTFEAAYPLNLLLLVGSSKAS